MKSIFILVTFVSSFAFARTEVVCESRADVFSQTKPEMSQGTEINKRIRQLEEMGHKNIEISHLSTSTAVGGSGSGYTGSIDKVCAVLKY